MIKTLKNSLNRYNLKYARFAMLYIILAAIAAAAGTLTAISTGNMTQAAELGMSKEMMNFLIILAASSLIKALIDGITALLRQKSFGRAIHSIRSVFVRNLLSMPYEKFSEKNSGEGVSLFTNDVQKATNFVTNHILSQISQLITLLISAAYMMYINWWLTLAYLALFPLLALIQAKMSAPIAEKAIYASKEKAKFTAIVADALQNPLIVKTYGLEYSVQQRFDASFMQMYRALYGAAKIRVRLALTGVFATVTPTFALGIVACAVAIKGNMTIAEFITLTVVSDPVGSWLMMFTQDLARLRESSASATRLDEYLQISDGLETPLSPADDSAPSVSAPPSPVGESAPSISTTSSSVDESAMHESTATPPVGESAQSISATHLSADDSAMHESTATPPVSESAVIFDDVHFKYSGDEGSQVFAGVSFNIKKGSITAISGRSGCGKSTALKLMLSLYNPNSGNISITSERVTYVPQDCYLLPITIKENIICNLPYDEERFRDACENAGIFDFISSLPNQADTILDESAANVSGGQKQRIALARAFYYDADLLLLDEATSALDPTTEKSVLDAFSRYVKENDKTAIAVAHRQSVLDISDYTITLSVSEVDSL